MLFEAVHPCYFASECQNQRTAGLRYLRMGQGAQKLEFGVVMRRPDVYDAGTFTPAFVLDLDRGRATFAFYFSDVSCHTLIVY